VPGSFLELKGARQHNLKGVDVRIPLNALTVVSGVSGSGKTTLVRDILAPALQQHLPEPSTRVPGVFEQLEGPVRKITAVEFINQSPIGRSSRSNPVTYVKAYDYIRDLFANQPMSKVRGFLPKHFSFNVEGGRCEACKGEGEQVVEMQFLADVHLECEECKGRRFRNEVLDVTVQGKSIYEVLKLSVEEALEFFKQQKEIVARLQPLMDVGLGYVQLGQSSSTLSGGEAQRVKLASFLIKDHAAGHIFLQCSTGYFAYRGHSAHCDDGVPIWFVNSRSRVFNIYCHRLVYRPNVVCIWLSRDECFGGDCVNSWVVVGANDVTKFGWTPYAFTFLGTSSYVFVSALCRCACISRLATSLFRSYRFTQ
jgi:energy-coupling factor transporter ATP-binding protein EcfA2